MTTIMEEILENDTLTNENEIDTTSESETTSDTAEVEQSQEEKDTPIKTKLPTEIEKEILTLKAQKEHFKKKVEKLEAKLKELSPSQSSPTIDDPIKLVKLAKVVQEYSPEELEFIMKVAKSSSFEDILAAANDEWVKTAIATKREQIKKSNQVLNPSASSETSLDYNNLMKLAKDKNIPDQKVEELTRKLWEEELKKQRGENRI